MASFAMAHTTIMRGHVAVEVLTEQLSDKTQRIIFVVTSALSILLFILLAYECFRFGNDLRIENEVSLTLQIPFFPVLYGISFSSIVVCFVIFVDFWKVLLGKEKPWFPWKK